MSLAPDKESLWLPPLESQLINPATEKIDTPVDERGLIDIPQLITDVKATVDPDFEWPSALSIHHFYWPSAAYPYETGHHNSTSAGTFRNLPLHKGLLPRVFENWLHKVTLPPEVPEAEVMQYRIEAWSIVKDLFKTARETVVHEKLARRRREYIAANPEVLKVEFNGEDHIGEEYIQLAYEKNFRGWEQIRERHERIPQEFRLIQLDRPPTEIASSLGKLAVPKSMKLVRSVVGN